MLYAFSYISISSAVPSKGCVTLSTTTAFLESTSTPLPANKSELGITPEKDIFDFDIGGTAQEISV